MGLHKNVGLLSGWGQPGHRGRPSPSASQLLPLPNSSHPQAKPIFCILGPHNQSLMIYFKGPKGIALRPCPPPSPHPYATRTPGVYVLTQSCVTLQPHGLYPTRLLCPWDSPAKNTGADCHFLLQGNRPDPGIEPASLASPALTSRFPLYHLGKPRTPGGLGKPYSLG